MSRETMEWLNTQTLIGFTDQRGKAWHYRENEQGAEPNHYPGAIPQDDVLRRLFDFEVVEQPIYLANFADDAEVTMIPGRKAMVTSDTNEVLGIFKDGYQGHSYREWLLENVSAILDDDLKIGSAGLLRNRGQAWVSVEMEDNFTTPEGVEFRPYLLASTSFDGSAATSYGRKVTLVVCDNTREVALAEQGQSFKLRHSKYSHLKLNDARKALEIVHGMADDFAAEVAALTSYKVEDAHFKRIMDALVPLPKDEGRGLTVATKKRDEIITLYRKDERVTPWTGTAFGVAQAFNTHAQHVAQVRKGTPRVIRNMENVVKGKFAQSDAQVLEAIFATA
jgi:phage/plasmid-like protein (TIGR03299 family)